MKTLSTFLSFLTVASLAAFFSCKKNDPTPNSVDGLLTYRGWQILSASAEGIPHSLEPYYENDYFVFYANGTYAIITGEDEIPLGKYSLSGAVPEKQSNYAATWALSGDHTILTLIDPNRSGTRTDGTRKEIVHYKIGIAKDKLVLTEIEGKNTPVSVWTFKPKEGEPAGGAVSLKDDSDKSGSFGSVNARFASSEPATEWGFCWGDVKDPAIERNSKTTEDLGTGSLKGLVGFVLTPNSDGTEKIKVPSKATYYLRAYAKNSRGTFYSTSVKCTNN
ncbi:MAG: hypothetical protein CRN43_20425 [Candidatus Nephrothrix sp. EaCA]|nr:MAG: hypothetical protein CRN43_20425 [Candidatus Nephrothrix sp. EaCA]